MKKILITGAKGFIGSNAAKYFKRLGFRTYGIGRGELSVKASNDIGIDYWKNSEISIKDILDFDEDFDVIIHCAGSGSVSFSVENPYQDFKNTVNGTLEVLEYIRLYNFRAHLIYPSSPAVQGECKNSPIKEEYKGKPLSPYGYHKRIAEDLCQSYNQKYNIKISIVRLYSVYGKGLRKQLLWDAFHKIKQAKDEVTFFGTGNEIRDFIHVEDALFIFETLFKNPERFIIINGGTGHKSTVKSIVEMIRDLVDNSIKIKFDNKVNEGNPSYYCADTIKLEQYGIKVQSKLSQEIKNYINWTKNLND